MLILKKEHFLLVNWRIISSKDRLLTKYIEINLQNSKGQVVSVFDNFTNYSVFYSNLIDSVKSYFNDGYPFVDLYLSGIYQKGKSDLYDSFNIAEVISVSGLDFDQTLESRFPDVTN